MNSDGRKFGWQRARGGSLHPCIPVIVWDTLHGCAKCEFVGELHMLLTHEYGLSLADLENLYPAPVIQPEA